MQVKLTKRTIDAITPPTDGKRAYFWSVEVPGFGVMVTPSGAKSFLLRYRAGKGREAPFRKVTLGTYGAITLAQAAEEAHRILATVALGADPVAEAKTARVAETVQDAIELFITRYASQNKSGERITAGILRKDIVPVWGDRKLADIRRRDVIDLLEGVIDSGRPVQANRVFSQIRKLFNWCRERDMIEVSPCAGVHAPTQESSRDRTLDDDELAEVWRAAEMMSYPFGPFVHLLILTAQRRDEVAGMRWDELDLEAAMWTIPKERAKNVKAHQVPLPPMAVDFLREIPKLSEHVFTTTGRTPISGYSKAKVHLDLHILKARAKAVEDAGGDPKKCEQMADWTFHDLRRTVATGMARMNVSRMLLKKS